MIAVSSYRPFSQCVPEIANNQVAAKLSWNMAFSKIIYLGSNEPRLADSKTQFISSDDPPTIRQLASVCASQDGWTALVNADIVILPTLYLVESRLKSSEAKCAMSRRWEFEKPGVGKLVDLGLDFFCAVPEVWARVSRDIPKEFKLGHILFDTWLLSYFVWHWKTTCWDVTPAKIVFHPNHEYRRDQSTPSDIGRNYIDSVRWPKNILYL